MGALSDRRSQTQARIQNLRNELTAAKSIAAGKACVYATGSYGRGEASEHSDLDLFILGKSKPRGDNLLKRLDDIRIKANLINATEKLRMRKFSGDGRYLNTFSVHELTKTLGTEHDDVTNTFTARLLLLLESYPLLEAPVYKEVTSQVIAAYWRDQSDLRSAKPIIVKLLKQYERFLETTNVTDKELVRCFLNKRKAREYMNAAYKFGDLIFKALNHIGNGNRFHRVLVV